jgi:hypothetical protein
VVIAPIAARIALLLVTTFWAASDIARTLSPAGCIRTRGVLMTTRLV